MISGLPAPVSTASEIAEMLATLLYAKPVTYADQLQAVQTYDRIACLINAMLLDVVNAKDRVDAATKAMNVKNDLKLGSILGWEDLRTYSQPTSSTTTGQS
jgi:hypothetical protein